MQLFLATKVRYALKHTPYLMKYVGNTNEYFEILNADANDTSALDKPIEGQLSVVWFQEGDNSLVIDNVPSQFKKDEILCLTSFHKVDITRLGKTKILRFNSPFYCILNQDSEVGCKGILFFGSKTLPVLRPSVDDLKSIQSLTQMVQLEMQSKDELQQEMLQMLLKRLLILCTRIYKSTQDLDKLPPKETDLIREYNFLVEQYFKKTHTVAEYAQMLNKSPKTLSNLFGKSKAKSPLKTIQDRIMLEARRLLRYTDAPISEIGYEIGFQDIQTFSRFFKKNEGISPSEFRLV